MKSVEVLTEAPKVGGEEVVALIYIRSISRGASKCPLGWTNCTLGGQDLILEPLETKGPGTYTVIVPEVL